MHCIALYCIVLHCIEDAFYPSLNIHNAHLARIYHALCSSKYPPQAQPQLGLGLRLAKTRIEVIIFKWKHQSHQKIVFFKVAHLKNRRFEMFKSLDSHVLKIQSHQT